MHASANHWIIVSSLEDSFFLKCKFRKFNPRRPTLTNFDILMHFGQLFGEGITKSELKQAFRQCSDCHNLLYADRRSHHSCDEDALHPEAANFDLMQELLGMETHSGLSPADFKALVVRCDGCQRFCLSSVTHHHECPRERK